MGRRGEDGELALRFMDQADAVGLGQAALAEVNSELNPEMPAALVEIG